MVRALKLRMDAAKAAAIRFEKSALSTIDANKKCENIRYDISPEPLTPEQWAEKFGATKG